MSVLDKFLNVMRLNPDDDDDFYNEDYDYDDDYEEDEPVKSKSSFRKDKKKAEEDDYEEDKPDFSVEFYRHYEDEEGTPSIESIPDDEEYEMVAEVFEQIYAEEEDAEE